jgi:hypothetical protein
MAAPPSATHVPIASSIATSGLDPLTLVGESVGPASRAGTRTRTVLRQLGVRTATDLIKAFPLGSTEARLGACATGPTRRDPEESDLVGVDRQQIRSLVRVLSEEHGLAAVWNWQDRGVRARCPMRRPPSSDTAR